VEPAVQVPTLPQPSVALTVIAPTRPSPAPERSARSWTSVPFTTASGQWIGPPVPVTGTPSIALPSGLIRSTKDGK
jgi:hypothetical protein